MILQNAIFTFNNMYSDKISYNALYIPSPDETKNANSNSVAIIALSSGEYATATN